MLLCKGSLRTCDIAQFSSSAHVLGTQTGLSLNTYNAMNNSGYKDNEDALHRSGFMMTSSNGNILRFTGPLWGEFTGDRWIPLTKASEAELWCFLWSSPEHKVEQTTETPVIWDATAPIMA